MKSVEPYLRPVRANDATAVLAAFTSHPDMARQGAVTTLAEAEAYLARILDPANDRVGWAIVADERMVGLVGIDRDTGHRTGWLWYWMHAEFRGRGWTSRAAATVANWAMDAAGCDRLELGHRVNNPASAIVAAHAGFVREGTEREKFLIDG